MSSGSFLSTLAVWVWGERILQVAIGDCGLLWNASLHEDLRERPRELSTFFSIIRLHLMSKRMFSFLVLWNMVY